MNVAILHEFKDVFLKGDYKKCIGLLKKCLNDESSLSKIKSNCSKTVSDDISEKCCSFLCWIIEQNITVCELLMNIITDNECDYYEMYFSKLRSIIIQIQGLPGTKEHLCLEFIMLYNYTIINLICGNSSTNIWSDIVWNIINPSFKRVQTVLQSSKWKCNEQLDMIDNIFFIKNLTLIPLSKLEKESLYYFCFGIGWLAMIQDDDKLLGAVIQKMMHIQGFDENHQLSEIKQHLLKLFTPNDVLPSQSFLTSDAHELFIACLALKRNNYDASLLSLDKVSVSEWKHFVLYIKGYIYYKKNDLKLSEKYCMEFWSSRRNSNDQLSSRFANLLGCCFFMQNEFLQAEKWFYTSTCLDEQFLLPKYNLSMVFFHLNKISSATKLFKQLSEKSNEHTSFADTIFQNYLLKYCSEMIFIEVEYYLAHFYVNLESYSKAVIIFIKLFQFLQQNKLQIFSMCSHDRIPCFFQLLYVEGSYAFLQAYSYEKCLQTCNCVLQILPFNPNEKPLLSDWIFDVIPSLMNDETVLMESSDNDLSSDSNHLEHNGEIDLKKIGIYFQNKDASILSRRKELVESKFLYVITLFLKALAFFKTSILPEASLTMNRARTYALELLGEIINFERYDEKHSTDIEKETVANTVHITPNITDSIMDELFIDSISPLDKGSHNYENMQSKDDQYNSGNEKEIFQIREIKQEKQCNDICTSDINFLLSEIYNNLAIFCIAQDELENVDNYFKIASECFPGNIDVVYNMCLWELKRKNFEAAQIHWTASKQQSTIIDNILTHSVSLFPYGVSFEELDSLNSILTIDNDICISFDVNWDD